MMNLPDAIDAIRPSIVQVLHHSPDPGLSRRVGTGFLLNSDAYVATAKHVVDSARRLSAVSGEAVSLLVGIALPVTADPSVSMRGNFVLVDVQLVAEDQRHDLALLKMLQNPFKGEVTSGIVIGDKSVLLPSRAAPAELARPRDGEAVAVSGYPLGQPVLITNAGVIASSWISDIEQVTIPGVGTFSLDLADVYWVDATANSGNSGGPIYRIETGAVIGMCVASPLVPIQPRVEVEGKPLGSSAGITAVIPSQYIADIADQNGTSWL